MAYPPIVVARTIIGPFFSYRGIRPDPGLDGLTDDRITNDIGQYGLFRAEGWLEAPRGKRDWVVFLVLGGQSNYSRHGADLRKLLERLHREPPALEDRLAEVFVVLEEPYLTKNNIIDIVADLRHDPKGADPDGWYPFYTVCPYYRFACVIPEHVEVLPHRIMTDTETADLLRRERKERADFPVILATDAPVVWAGGRTGQMVEIATESQTALAGFEYRRIERGPY